MTADQRQAALEHRVVQRRPLHSLGHNSGRSRQFMVTAACYEHKHWIGGSPERMARFEAALIDALSESARTVHAHVILPNHYHALLTLDVEAQAEPDAVKAALDCCLKSVFGVHQKTGFHWNQCDKAKGGRVWCNVAETAIRSDRHFQAARNYIHHNPVKHGYCDSWLDWPYSSAAAYLNEVGREQAVLSWQEYDISDMGKWDVY